MSRLIIAVALLLVASLTSAAPLATQREITGLFDALSSSECRFNRNGTWYDATAAREHLQRKYDWLRKRDALASTERFIDLAASKSSMTGRAYRVQCAGAAEVDSATWFRARLAALRSKH